MGRFGSSRKTHQRRAHFRKVELEDLVRDVHEDVARGDCSDAYNHLIQAAETAGYLGAERRSAGSGSSGERAGFHELSGAYSKFEKFCVVGQGGGLGATRGGSLFPLYDEPGIDQEPEFDEPEEDDIVTYDHKRWYMNGRLYFTGTPKQLAAKLNADHFWPNVWFISDHGNAHLISRLED